MEVETLEALKGIKRAMDKCYKCAGRFSDWFTWEGVRHCYPCWAKSDFTEVTLEDGRTISTHEGD